MKIQFENMRGRPALGGTSDQSSASRGGAILPRNSNLASGFTAGFAPFPCDERSTPVAWSRGEETTKLLSPSSSHRTAHNPLLPFGKFTQTVIDGLAMLTCLVLICATGVGLAVSVFFLLFCKF